jgi:hypothetical protein
VGVRFAVNILQKTCPEALVSRVPNEIHSPRKIRVKTASLRYAR